MNCAKYILGIFRVFNINVIKNHLKVFLSKLCLESQLILLIVMLNIWVKTISVWLQKIDKKYVVRD